MSSSVSMAAYRHLRRWQHSVGVILPAIAILVLTATGLAAFVLWSAGMVDDRELRRERSVVSNGIEREMAHIPRVQGTVALWDDALEHTLLDFDKEWLDDNLGIWMRDYYGFEAAAVVSDRDEPIYTTVDGQSPTPEWFAARWDEISPLIADLRAAITAGALADHAAGGPYPAVREVVLLAGMPAVVSIVPITSSSGTIPQPLGREYLHVVIDYLDASFAQKLQDTYGVERAAFTLDAATAGRASHPLFDGNGKLVTFFEWDPQRPGNELLAQTGPALIIAFLAIGALVIALASRLWRFSSMLDTERRAIKHQATHDALTGLPNRAQFETQLKRDLVPYRGRPDIALLLLDLDRFKQVNDTLGHIAGDDLICAVGQRVKELLGPADSLARLGGDEFAVIHLAIGKPASALKLANAIIEAIGKPFDIAGSEAFVGTSIGLAVAGNERDPRELMRKADIALYEAKAQGRNRVVQYEEAMNAQLQERHTIEAELREALKRDDQLSVAFQPLFSGATGEIEGVEALARWHHPRLGPISPARFIPIAESAGLIEALGEFVLRRACTFGARWPGYRVAVNISPAQLRNPRFPERVFDLMVETAMRPSDLELEITESILLESETSALEAIATFRKAGIRVALDDFGTGYSSLNYLKQYPVDSIKIDRSFVAQLAPESSSAAIVQAMVTLAHALGIDVVAEGVETHEQMSLLSSMGCNLFQGFLLATPAGEADIEERFRRAAERRRSVARVA